MNTSNTPTPITGSIVALITPFHEDGSVDYAVQRVVAQFSSGGIFNVLDDVNRFNL